MALVVLGRGAGESGGDEKDEDEEDAELMLWERGQETVTMMTEKEEKERGK